jgi:hypothetical protein
MAVPEIRPPGIYVVIETERIQTRTESEIGCTLVHTEKAWQMIGLALGASL